MSDDEEEDSTFYGVAVPNDLKSLRACKVCTLVMSYDQFYRNGCLNCKDLQIAEDRDGISKYTTPHFEGIIGLIKPKKSWIAKYQRLVNKVKGTYACSIFETPSPELIRELKATGITYVDRTNDITAASSKK